MSASNYVHLEDVTIVKATDKAFLIEYDDERHWIPLSQVANPDDYEQGDEDVSISVTEWIADQKGIG